VRLLLLDSAPVPEDRAGAVIVKLNSAAELNQLYVKYLKRTKPPDLILDIRWLNHSLQGRILKFVEEYKGSLVIRAMDPILSTILSRMVKVIKLPYVDPDKSLIKMQIGEGGIVTRKAIEYLKGL